jgi:hypothetical protein
MSAFSDANCRRIERNVVVTTTSRVVRAIPAQLKKVGAFPQKRAMSQGRLREFRVAALPSSLRTQIPGA